MAIKKGFFFSTDAIIALFILIIGITSISLLHLKENPKENLYFASSDIANILSSTKVNELNNSYLNDLVENGTITDNSSTILEQIGYLWAQGQKDIANRLAENITSPLVPDSFGLSFVIDGDTLYTNNYPDGEELVSHKSLITGIEDAKPLNGTSARIYFSSMGRHLREEYIFFGGFVGQGNISRFFEELPHDAEIEGFEMEIAAGDDFTLYINEEKCDDFTVTSKDMHADHWDIHYCKDLIETRTRNNITLFFNDEELDNQFISGGHLSIKYTTNEIYSYETSTERYYFPEIEGMANLYSSIPVPPNLESINIHLHFKSNYTTYLTIGGRTVFNELSNGTTRVNISDSELTSFPILLDYEALSNSTVPIRFSSFNSSEQTVLTNGSADVILLNDISGSMQARIGEWDFPPPGSAIPHCSEGYLDDPSVRRTGVTTCLNYVMNDIIMNESIPPGNRLWISDYYQDANPFFSNDLTELTHSNIEQEIDDRYGPAGTHKDDGICLSCSINQAYEIFSEYSEEERQRHVIIMTDGFSTHCSEGYWEDGIWKCNETSTGTEGKWPGDHETDCERSVGACEAEACLPPANDAIHSAKRLHDNLNVTIHAVGMGPISECTMANYTLSQIANVSNGSFIISQNATELLNFYRDVAIEIREGSKLSAQKLNVKGNLSPSILYGDSYIEYEFTPEIDPPKQGEFPLYFHERSFDDCSAELYIPEGLRIIDFKITSFSDEYWTHLLTVNNSAGNTTIFNLTKFSGDFSRLGDPHLIDVPPGAIKKGEINEFRMTVGDGPMNSTGCSSNNSLIYTGMIDIFNASAPYSEVLPKAEGCTWHVENYFWDVMTVEVPHTYTGVNTCYYTNSSHGTDYFNQNDSYDVAMYNLLKYMDYNDDGRVFMDFDSDDLSVNMKILEHIPYLWGPAIAEVRVWK